MEMLFDREDFTKKFAAHSESNPRWSGQIEQDKLVYQLLGNRRKGFFIELASNDAVYLSNSFALEQYFGWNGICVEGNPLYWYWLAFRKCKVVGAMTGRTKGEKVQVNFSGGETGGIVDHESVKGGGPGKKVESRQTTTLMEILETFQAPKIIEYMSLDVEGAEEHIMSGFDFQSYTFLLMTVERPSLNLSKLLTDNGYQKVKIIGKSFGESLWKHASVQLHDEENVLTQWCSHSGTCEV
eukprot:CAMPEP_0198140944 /NCGR_PEP_ID=MMETSP1443-20131203/4027_1 /TAXON_ID=186043 /ORGANISM="Entomoneis sp., Strain CCMP2396" /LENGTH=239 /DNA_ID=CAMNT_0043803527 /DNA_START=266 /DNA_END=985 /DNA_ORIENTATION=+